VRGLRTVTAVLAWSLIVVAVAVGASFAVDSAERTVGTSGTPVDVVLPPPPTTSPAAPKASSTRSPTVRATPSSSRTSPASSPSPTPSRAPSGTYSGEGGVVVVQCQGTALLAWSVWPSAGWKVETRQLSVVALDVEFSMAGRRSYAHGTCGVAGPSISTVPSPAPSSSS
jgi:hypothetical protein